MTANKNRRILYIEDNQANIELMKTIFMIVPQLSLETAKSAELGLDLARHTKPHLILMDINLPGMSGLEALYQLRATPDTQDIPVIAISAAAMKKDIDKATEAGFYAYLTKPFDVTELLNMAADLLPAPEC